MDTFSLNPDGTSAASLRTGNSATRRYCLRSASFSGATVSLDQGPALHHSVTSPPAVRCTRYEAGQGRAVVSKAPPGKERDPQSTQKQPKPEVPDVWTRFSASRKKIIVAIVSLASFNMPLSSTAFLPSIPVITRDLSTTEDLVNVSVAVYLIAVAIFPLLWSPLAFFYGRKPIYLASLPIFALGCVGVALSQNMATLFVTRIIAAAGASSVLSVGAGTIADVYHPSERGGAMAVYLMPVLLGPCIAPVLAGVCTEYIPNDFGWRAVQWILCGFGAVTSLLVFTLLPETAHSTGMQRRLQSESIASPKNPRFLWHVPNPLEPLSLLLKPTILLTSLVSSFVLLQTYLLLIPITTILSPRYNLTNYAIQGVLFLAPGAGNLLGARCSGRLSTAAFERGIKKQNGLFIAEDRLRCTLIWNGVVQPVCMVAYGLTLQFWHGPGGLAFALILQAIASFSMMIVLPVCNTYLVDQIQARSVEAIAVNNGMRYLFSAAGSAFILPLSRAITIAGANGVGAGLGLLGAGMTLFLIKFGHAIREKEAGRSGQHLDLPQREALSHQETASTDCAKAPDIDNKC